jgi:hypothetical protein
VSHTSTRGSKADAVVLMSYEENYGSPLGRAIVRAAKALCERGYGHYHFCYGYESSLKTVWQNDGRGRSCRVARVGMDGKVVFL